MQEFVTPPLENVHVNLGGMVLIALVRLSFFEIMIQPFKHEIFRLQNLIVQRMDCAQIKEPVMIQ